MARSQRKQLAKKQRERIFLETVRANYQGFPAGEVVETEAPDFVINSDISVGIEITCFPYTDNDAAQKVRQQEGEWEKAVANACALYAALSSTLVDVAVVWNPHYDLSRKRRTTLEVELSNAVTNNVPEAGCIVTLGFNESCCVSIPVEIHSIRIFRYEHLTRNHWASHLSGWVKTLCPQDFREIIRKKEKYIGKYRDHAVEAWLICVLEGLRPSSFVEISPATLQEIYHTRFDRVLILEYFDRRVHSLRVQNLKRGINDDVGGKQSRLPASAAGRPCSGYGNQVDRNHLSPVRGLDPRIHVFV